MDGRELLTYREMIVKKNPLDKAEGSAEVWLGKTHVLVGVKAGIGTPFEDTPDEGVLMVGSEFTPVAHQTWEPGPPNEKSIELSRVVDRGLRSAEVLNMKEFCVIPGEKVYIMFIDLYILNYDGNLIDACAAGAIAALESANIPEYKVTKGKIEITNKKKLKLERVPLAVTFAKIGDYIILDPTDDEEEILDARLTITVDEEGNITTIQKSGGTGLTLEEIENCIKIALENAPKLRTIAMANE
jgi:exosome complex component RRP42